ncbi:MAG: DUF6544 family protein [Chitinophagaceae bacterium]
MQITLLIVFAVALTLTAAKIRHTLRFNEQVRNLFSQSKSISGKSFSYQQLVGLPDPVQRYFKHVLQEGKAYISYVQLKHDGHFKPGLKKAWSRIKGEQYFTTEKPGFIWKGKTWLFTALDSYINCKGRLVVTILSLFKVVNAAGPHYNEGELLRWLAESVWFPTNLLPCKELEWTPIDNLSARLHYKYAGLAVSLVVNVNEKGEITEMKTTRYMNDEPAAWICKMYNYEAKHGYIIPTSAEALWRLEKGDFSYARFTIKTISYNTTEVR